MEERREEGEEGGTSCLLQSQRTKEDKREPFVILWNTVTKVSGNNLVRSASVHRLGVSMTITSYTIFFNGHLALTGHTVKNQPYWMAKKCSRFKHKGVTTCQAWLSFVIDVPQRMPWFFAIQYGGSLTCDQLVQKAHLIVSKTYRHLYF